MIFRENSVKNGVEKDGDLFYFFHYIASRNNTDNFDERSKIFLINFKNGRNDTVQSVFEQLNPHLNNASFAVCAVPPHNAYWQGNDGPHKLARKIVQSMSAKNKQVVDATDCVVRTKNAKPRKFGDDIEFKDTLIIKNIDKIKDKDILLIDDVYTTGKTIGYIENLLKANGAGKVIKFVVCKTLNPSMQFNAQKPNEKKGYIIDIEDVVISRTALKEQSFSNVNPDVVQTIKKLDNYITFFSRIMGKDIKIEKQAEVCLVTNGKRKNIENIARELDIDKIIDCRDGKTHTERILAAKTLLQTYERNTFVIGSTDVEMQIAKYLHMNAVLVKWFHQEKENDADMIISNTEDFTAESLLQLNDLSSVYYDRKELNLQEIDDVHELYHKLPINLNNDINRLICREQEYYKKLQCDDIKAVPVKISNAKEIWVNQAASMDEKIKRLASVVNAKRIGKPNVKKILTPLALSML
ncbi:hypothetical protein [Phascolarctobacterium succinatutens]|uniref:hypothetical protein n=1 Tax=Phascolarctobacterium succinatutens TaxID=626940 RepID=UPI003AF0E0DB